MSRWMIFRVSGTAESFWTAEIGSRGVFIYLALEFLSTRYECLLKHQLDKQCPCPKELRDQSNPDDSDEVQ